MDNKDKGGLKLNLLPNCYISSGTYKIIIKDKKNNLDRFSVSHNECDLIQHPLK